NKGAGLMMLGGPSAFGNPNPNNPDDKWIGTPIEGILPVRLRDDNGNPIAGQIINDSLSLKPTPEGLKYLLRIADTPKESTEAWRKIQDGEGAGGPLDGATKLGPAVGGAGGVCEVGGGQGRQPPAPMVGREGH